MPNDDVLTGGCLCGSIRYEAWGPPGNQIICHCKMCQRASGSAMQGLMYMAAANIRLTKGTPRSYRSSSQVDRLFCSDCGSPLFFQRTNFPDRRAILVGSLDDSNKFQPNVHVCCSSAVNWLDMHDDAPRYDEKPESMGRTMIDYDRVTGATRMIE